MEAMCCLLRQVVVPVPSTDSMVWTWHSVWGGSLGRIMLLCTKRGWADLLHTNASLLVLADLAFSFFPDSLRGLYLVYSLIEVFLELLKVILAKGLSCEIRIWILIQSTKWLSFGRNERVHMMAVWGWWQRQRQSLEWLSQSLWKLHPHHRLQSAIPLSLKSQMMTIIVLLCSLSWSHQLKMMTLLWRHNIHRMILTIGKMRSQEISGLTEGLLCCIIINESTLVSVTRLRTECIIHYD